MDTGSFHCPEPMFIFKGAVEGNEHGHGVIVTGCIPKYPYFNSYCLLYRYNTLYLHFLYEFLYGHVNFLCDPAVSGLCRGLSPFCRYLDKNVSVIILLYGFDVK